MVLHRSGIISANIILLRTGFSSEYLEAKSCPDANMWMEAWNLEADSVQLTSLASPITYKQLPIGSVVIDSITVFKRKTDGRYKARMVEPTTARWSTTYALTVRISILRTFLAIVCTAGFFLNTMKAPFVKPRHQRGTLQHMLASRRGRQKKIISWGYCFFYYVLYTVLKMLFICGSTFFGRVFYANWDSFNLVSLTRACLSLVSVGMLTHHRK